MENNKLRILLADDEVHIRLIAKAYFAPYDVEIIEASNGREALDILLENNIDLVILDYTMPIMNGYEVIEKMFENEKLKETPVIVYTAGGFDSGIEGRLRTHSAAFIEKANLGEELIPTVTHLVGRRFQKKK